MIRTMASTTRPARRLAAALACLASGLTLGSAPGELVNISVRTLAGSGDATLVAGFVVSGSGTRPLMVRAVGPTLASAPFHLPGTLPDPRVQVFRDNAVVFENNDWADNAALAAAAGRVGAFPLVAGSRDAALLAPLTAGVYTAVAQGAAGTTGEVLLEVYDTLEPGVPAPAINNLSLRAALPAGGTMITGFVIRGDAPKRVLIRAVGPTLARFGVRGTLGDPRIRLFSGPTDVALNDDWTAAPNAAALADAARLAGAFPLSYDARDAAVLTALRPGAYTLHVDSAQATDAGTVLVEMYGADPEPTTPAPAPPPPAPGLPQVMVFAADDSASETGDTGSIVVLRSGALSAPLSVRIGWSGTATPGVDHAPLPTVVVIPAGAAQAAVTITPLADDLLEPPESVIATVLPDPAYALTALHQAGVLIADAPHAGATGWRAEFFNNNRLSGPPVLVRTDAAIDFEWQGARPDPAVNPDNFSVRWTGVLTPPATKDYTLIVNGDDELRIWINDELVVDRPRPDWRDSSVTIPLVGGIPHRVRVELIEFWGWARAKLWWSASGMSARPLGAVAAPTAIGPAATGLSRSVALVGEPFLAFIEATGGATRFTADGLPRGLVLNPVSGAITGVAVEPGEHTVWLGASDGTNGGSHRATLRVLAPGGEATRERFAPPATGLVVPFGAAPLAAGAVASLEVAATEGPQLHRLRGHLTAPETGNYRFWLAASGPAEFRLADGDQPGDASLRARVVAGTARREWSREPGQRSSTIRLREGERHYFEILHRSPEAGGHVTVGWIRPGQTGDAPFEVVPGFVLSPHATETTDADGRTIFLAALRPPVGINTGAHGTASLSLAADSGSARLALRLSGLGSEPTNIQIHLGGPGAGSGMPVRALPRGSFDSFTWNLEPVAGLGAADLVRALRTGELFVLVQTALHPAGELRGHFRAAIGSAEFQPPPPAPLLNPGPMTATDAARLLEQGSFGPTLVGIERLRAIGAEAWIGEQVAAPQTRLLPFIEGVRAQRRATDPEAGVWTDVLTEAWWRAAVGGVDQLRQRVALALGEILVVSEDSALGGNIDALAVYHDLLAAHAFGNYRDLLRAVTLNPAMGVYLSMARNRRPDPAEGVFPDENFAREVMQLFSIGLHRLHPDGTLVLDARGLPIPTYDQAEIVGLAHVFTGWSFASDDPGYNFLWGEPDFRRPMRAYPQYHDTGEKRILDGEVLPATRTAEQELDVVIDRLFAHPNTGPFLSRLLIQRLVTSNPSPAYVHRVAAVFADNGAGVRGDLGAIVRAILLDWEARSPEAAALPTFGKLREPIIRIAHLWRAFGTGGRSGWYDIAWIRDRIGQEPLQSPTVFNFFQPDYAPPGSVVAAGLVAPEFQITSDATISHLVNLLDYLAHRVPEWTEDAVLEVGPEAALVATPDALLDRLDLLLLSGRMSPEMRTLVRRLVTDAPSWQSAEQRVRSAVFTIVTSPDYAVQK